MLVPVLEAIEEAASLVNMTKWERGGSSDCTSMTACYHYSAFDNPGRRRREVEDTVSY